MDLELQKLMKLKHLEQNLLTLLQKIDGEINQTAVDWMHLRAIAEENYGDPKLDNQQTITDARKVNLTKLQRQIDDQSNAIKLDLSVKKSFSDNEEDEDEIG